MFEKLRDIFSARSYISGAMSNVFQNFAFVDRKDFKAYAEEGYRRNPAVFACIELLATEVKAVPIKLVEEKQDGEIVEITNSPVLDLLADPNPEQTYPDFTEWFVKNFLIGGNAHALLATSGEPLEDPGKPLRPGAKITSIWNIMPGDLTPKPGAIGLAGWKMGEGKNEKIFNPSRIMHLKTYNPKDRFMGMSPMDPAARDIDTMNEGLRYAYNVYKNNGQPQGILWVKAKLDQKDLRKASAQVDAAFNDPTNSGKWKIIDGGDQVELKQLSSSPKDVAQDKGRVTNEIGICMVYKVPPELIGIPNSKTFSNYKEARRSLYQEAVVPLTLAYLSKLNKSVVRPMTGNKRIRLEADFSEIDALREDETERWNRAANGKRAGLVTTNEARDYIGLPAAEDPEADTRLEPAGMIPVGMGGTAEPEKKDDDETDDDPQDPDARARRGEDPPLAMVGSGDRPSLFRAFDRRRTRWLDAAEAAFGKALAATFRQVEKRIKGIDGEADPTAVAAATDRGIREADPEWKKAFETVYLSTGLDFAQQVDSGLQDTYGRGHRPKEFRQDPTAWEQAISQYVAREGGTKIRYIDETTRKAIQREMAAGFEAGEGSAALAARVQALSVVQDYRTFLIARTEVISASNLGSQVAAKSFGIPLVKSWLSTFDTRTREDHAAAAGQQRALDEPFEVGGYQLQFPGDTSLGAAAEETIQCRCTQVYEPPDPD